MAQGSSSVATSLRRHYPDQVCKGVILSRYPGTPCSFVVPQGETMIYSGLHVGGMTFKVKTNFFLTVKRGLPLTVVPCRDLGVFV